MSIRPVFFFVIKIFVSEKQKIRIYLPLSIFCLNDFIESLADLAAFLNIVTFGKLKISFSKSKAFPHNIAMKKLQSGLYILSDFFTELSLFTGRTDFVDVKTDSEDEKVKVKIFTV
jgi:hypothetical protein